MNVCKVKFYILAQILIGKLYYSNKNKKIFWVKKLSSTNLERTYLIHAKKNPSQNPRMRWLRRHSLSKILRVTKLKKSYAGENGSRLLKYCSLTRNFFVSFFISSNLWKLDIFELLTLHLWKINFKKKKSSTPT